MSAPNTALPRRRFKHTEQPFPSPIAANTVDSSPAVTLAARSGPPATLAMRSNPPANPAMRRASPRKLPAPVEISRRTGGRPSRPFFYKHDSARSVHPHTCVSLDCAMVKALKNNRNSRARLHLPSTSGYPSASTGEQGMAFPRRSFATTFSSSLRRTTVESLGHRLPTAAPCNSWLGDQA